MRALEIDGHHGSSTDARIVRVSALLRKGEIMPSWLILILVGALLVILGVATSIGHFLIWIGAVVLVVSLILGLVGRGRSRV